MSFINNLPESEKQTFLDANKKETQPAKISEKPPPAHGAGNDENSPATLAPKRPGRPPKDRGRGEDAASKVHLYFHLRS